MPQAEAGKQKNGLPTKHSRKLPSGVLLKTPGKQPTGALSRLAGKAVVATVGLAGNPTVLKQTPVCMGNIMGNHWWKILKRQNIASAGIVLNSLEIQPECQ